MRAFIGACKNYSRIGALPVGLRGKIYGQPFKVLVQYDAFGGVRAQVYEDSGDGGLITEVTGRRGEVNGKAEALTSWAISRARKEGLITEGGKATLKKQVYEFDRVKNKSVRKIVENKVDFEKVKADVLKRSKAFIKNLHQEVVDFNKGKDTKTRKVKKPVTIGPKKTARKKPAAKFKTIFVREYKVPGYTVPKHKRRIRI